MSPTVQKLLNFVDSLIDAGGTIVSEKNPAYDSEITMITGLADTLNAKLNPTAAPAAQQIASAASALGASVSSAPGAVETVQSKTATATQKAGAIGIIIGDVESVGASLLALFHPTAPLPTPAAPAASTASS